MNDTVPLIDVFELPDWAYAALSKAGCRTVGDARRMLAKRSTQGPVRVPFAFVLRDLTMFTRSGEECQEVVALLATQESSLHEQPSNV